MKTIKVSWLESSLRSLSCATLAAAVGGCAYVSAYQDVRFFEPRAAAVDATGLTLVSVRASSGTLIVRGRDDLSEVEVSGEAGASGEELLPRVQLLTRREGDVLVVEAEIPDDLWREGSARLDIVVEMPARLALEIDDGSGSIEVSGVAGLRVEDGSGSLSVHDVPGAVVIDDGSGEIELVSVGSVEIVDGSGSIDILAVAGDVHISGDGSGSIVVREVGGSVSIDGDGSGSIEVETVAGDVRVRDDGSGGVTVRDVQGDLFVDEDGSGSVSYEGIGGRITVSD